MRGFYPRLAALIWLCGCTGTRSFGQQVLQLQKEIEMPGVSGRIDHMDIDIKGQTVYVAALGNNTVEAVDLKTGKIIHTIRGLSEPQGVCYIPKHHELFIANGGTGECLFYSTDTWQRLASVKYDDDADDARYDPGADRVYVGYGSGGIGVIDAASHRQIADIKLPAHPESFQLDARAGKLWVNVPGAAIIGVADLKQRKLTTRWRRLIPGGNFPMAYDSTQHRIVIGYRFPATLKVLDSQTGKEIFSSGMTGDADDLYWDEKTKQILVSGGSGAVDVFKQAGSAAYKEVARIGTRSGARTSLWVPALRIFILAARAVDGHPAGLLIYHMQD